MYSQSYGAGFHQLSHLPQNGAIPSLAIAGPSRAQHAGEMHHHFDLSHQPGPESLIGRPIYFTEGQFAGRTIRATLDEIQAAAFGRKYAKVDRRPLDPPPVACLRLYEVFNPGTAAQTEQELDYDNIHILGLMCTVDLIPVPPPSPEVSPPASPSYYPAAPAPDGTYTFRSVPDHNSHYPVASSPTTSKATTALAGTTFVQVDPIPWKGKTSLLFTFADLAVKSEGYFLLQYRFFDIYSKPSGHTNQPIQADCFGQIFRIYSSKEVPPLGRSTDLTKHLARYGVRVNVRETERKRKRKERPTILSSPFTTERVPDRILSDADGSDYDED
ncbi:Velvet domain-containing protein [Mycena indigotica]|uniref:Velvet domain-containing protein n=1 Tax=Mycena indigotica TaxID=2126181 RepID=A0A8H6VUT5_9AGAR|nr:Velvet domain-containing protein [Mycena indigotica]KAF7292756.1 Velvet domain-containing protein [Mycena indigotica]